MKKEYTERIRSLLTDVYGEVSGNEYFSYLYAKMQEFVSAFPVDVDRSSPSANFKERCRALAGKVFAIAYPDNVYDDSRPTLHTLSRFLKEFFPGVNGLHILPERLMSHDDVWPQDLFQFLSPLAAGEAAAVLMAEGILDERRRVTGRFEARREWIRESFGQDVYLVLETAYNSHFNDGGFSQKDRSRVDPRFGTVDDLKNLCSQYAVMLDFVVNHLDVDNPVLEAYKRGENDGSAFIIVSPQEYRRAAKEGLLDAVFRPRPFPLFTGMRMFPGGPSGMNDSDEAFSASVSAMTGEFVKAGLAGPDERLTAYLSISYKHANDQGLTARDQRCFRKFCSYLEEQGIALDQLYDVSEVQPGGMVFKEPFKDNPVTALCAAVGLDPAYGELYQARLEECFGRLFYVYTTFSESQVDINPLTREGFKLIVDDLFHLLGSGRQAMMRMDAIKYLWKKLGERNFDMEEGNRLIQVIRLVMEAVVPSTLPLDEINSPDSAVYQMGAEGGFSYVFGQVNAVPIAFLERTTRPLQNFQAMMKEQKPAGLLPFVMLSTHDGRSVQGLGVQHEDGHVSIAEFCRFRRLVEQLGGKVKFRSVPKGRIPAETWYKAVGELGIEAHQDLAQALFVVEGSELRVRESGNAAAMTGFFELMGGLAGGGNQEAGEIIQFMADWIYKGITPYELCCTSRSSFPGAENATVITPEQEADRLLTAQLYVLSAGQYVPAVYFNDLLGLGNDGDGYRASGKPRDLNRRKISFEEALRLMEEDPFTRRYVKGMNRMISARTADPAFMPLSSAFDAAFFGEEVFLHHPHHGGDGSFILGNISGEPAALTLDMTAYFRPGAVPGEFVDLLTNERFTLSDGASLSLVLQGFGRLWLKSASVSLSW